MRMLTLGIGLVMLNTHAHGQVPSPAARLAFEVASIKRNVSGDPNASIRLQPGGQMRVSNNSLFNLIRNAYGTQRYEMIPGQKLQPWVDSDRWDILAKAPAGAYDAQSRRHRCPLARSAAPAQIAAACR